jgi:hypothetical protein
MAHLLKIAEAKGEKRANAVFFHGLGGNAYTTWQADKKHKATFWPAWLAEDIEGLSVYSVGYEAPVSRWRGTAMHLIDRAKNVLGTLLDEPSLANGALFLIGHSLGGLLIKQILRTAQSEAQYYESERAASFLRRVEKIAFLATPHAGADLAVWGARLRILIRPSAATICLVRNDPNLRELTDWYRGWSNHENITNLVLTETKSLSILGMIVKPDSSDPGLAGPRPRPMDCGHESICKPRNRASDIYIAIRRFIESPIKPVSRDEKALGPEFTRICLFSGNQPQGSERSEPWHNLEICDDEGKNIVLDDEFERTWKFAADPVFDISVENNTGSNVAIYRMGIHILKREQGTGGTLGSPQYVEVQSKLTVHCPQKWKETFGVINDRSWVKEFGPIQMQKDDSLFRFTLMLENFCDVDNASSSEVRFCLTTGKRTVESKSIWLHQRSDADYRHRSLLRARSERPRYRDPR